MMGLILKRMKINLKKFKLKFLIGGFICPFTVGSLYTDVKATNSSRNNYEIYNSLLQKEIIYKSDENILEKTNKKLLVNNDYLPSEIKSKNEITLKIDQLMQIIIDNNSEYKAALQRVDQAKARLVATISLRSPTIDLKSNGLPEYLLADHYVNPKIHGTSYKKSQQWKTSISASARWDIINPTRNPQINAAKKTFDKAKNSFLIVTRDLELKSKIAFANLNKSQEMLAIAKNAVNLSYLSLKDARLRNKALVATDLEVLEAETQLSRDQIFLSKSIRNNKIAKRELINSLGVKPNLNYKASLPGELLGVWENNLEDSISSALNYRASIINHNLDIAINNDKAKEELGKSRPNLSLINTFSFSNEKGQTEIAPPVDESDYERNYTNTIGLFSEWKIFDAGKSKQLSKFYKKKSLESKYRIKTEEAKIVKNVENNFNNLETATQNIYSNSRDIFKSKKMLDISRMRFKAGVTNQREIVNSQRDLTQSQINYIDSINQYNISILKLKRDTGINNIKKCNFNELNKEQNKISFDSLSSMQYPIVPLNKACEASIKSLNSLQIDLINDFDKEDILQKNKKLNNNNQNIKEKSSSQNTKELEKENKSNEKNLNPNSENIENKSSNNLEKIEQKDFKFNFSNKNKTESKCSLNIKDNDICLDEFL